MNGLFSTFRYKENRVVHNVSVFCLFSCGGSVLFHEVFALTNPANFSSIIIFGDILVLRFDESHFQCFR